MWQLEILTKFAYSVVCLFYGKKKILKQMSRKCNSIFLCFIICRAPREVLKPESERRGFQYQHLPRDPADVNVSENHVCSLLLHKTVCQTKTLEKMLRKLLFSCTYTGAERRVTWERFKTPLPVTIASV